MGPVLLWIPKQFPFLLAGSIQQLRKKVKEIIYVYLKN